MSPRRRRAGLTLTELMVYLALSSLVGVTVSALTRSTSAAYRTITISVHNDARAHRAVSRVKELLRFTGAGQIDPKPQSPLFATEAEFARTVGQDAGVCIGATQGMVGFARGLGEGKVLTPELLDH